MPDSPSSTQEQAVLALARQRSLIRARDVSAQGLPTMLLTRLVMAGQLVRVARGLYGLPSRDVSEHGSLAEVCLRVPHGVVCLLSALRVHGLGTQAPFEVWLAMPNHAPTPRITHPALRVIRMSDAALAEGIEPVRIDGVTVPVFNAAKTVADAFKFRNKIGIDVALEALREGWSGRRLTMDELWRYASINRVTQVMRPYLESVVI
jgi:predicted transcriptional regulator of viral defense system